MFEIHSHLFRVGTEIRNVHLGTVVVGNGPPHAGRDQIGQHAGVETARRVTDQVCVSDQLAVLLAQPGLRRFEHIALSGEIKPCNRRSQWHHLFAGEPVLADHPGSVGEVGSQVQVVIDDRTHCALHIHQLGEQVDDRIQVVVVVQIPPHQDQITDTRTAQIKRLRHRVEKIAQLIADQPSHRVRHIRHPFRFP